MKWIRGNLYFVASEYAPRLPALRYCDIRLEVREEKRAASENDLEKGSSEDSILSFGVRVIGSREVASPGYYGRILGFADAQNLERVLRQ